MSATPASLSAHWKKFLFAGLAALAVVWYFASKAPPTATTADPSPSSSARSSGSPP